MKLTKEEFDREAAETVEALPQDIPESVMEKRRNAGSLKKQVILYRSGYYFDPLEDRKKRAAVCKCTACGGTFYMQQVNYRTDGCCSPAYYASLDTIGVIDSFDGREKKTRDTMLCPLCGTGATLVHVGQFRTVYTIAMEDVLTVHEINGHLALLSWHLEKYVDKDGNAGIVYNRREGVVVIDRKLIRVAGLQSGMCGTYYVLPKWTARKRYSEELGEMVQDCVEIPEPGLVERTDSANCALREYLTGREKLMPGGYLRIWTRWPQAENLVRQGFDKFLGQVIEDCRKQSGYYCARHSFDANESKLNINWKEVKPHRMLGVRKEDLWIAKKYSLEVFEMFKRLDARGIRLGREELDLVTEFRPFNFWELWKEPLDGFDVPPVRMLHYLKKQKLLAGKNNGMIGPGYIRDYWKMVFEVYGKMEPGMLWPKNLQSAHDNIMHQLRIKESEALRAKFEARKEERAALAWRDDELGLFIRPAESQLELRKEGESLFHCVARYATEMAEGRTTILFIRHIAEPEKSYFTLEWKNGKVWQNRGKHNCARTPEVEAFEKEWVEHIKEMEKEKKHGKPDSKRNAGTVA